MFKGIIDTTLRDGQQSPLLFDSYKYRFTLEDKKKLVKGLINLGVRHLEFFSPVISDAEKNDFYEVKKYMESITSKKINLLAHCRCNEKDTKLAVESGFDGLNLYMNTTSAAQKYSYGKSKKEIRNHIKETIINTRKKYPKIYLRFSIEDAFRTSLKEIYTIFDSIYKYVDTLGIPDTVGIATPDMVKHRVRALRNRYPQTDFECHFHNDRGFALINTVTAILEGVAYADASIWGLAERSGITSLTGLLFNLHEYGHRHTEKYQLAFCYPLNVLMGTILKMQVPYNEPVSITNRTHIAGVHHKAVLKQARIYEAHHLEKFGVTKNQLLLGPLSGWNHIYYYLKEFEYFDITEDQAKEITIKFKNQSKKISKRFKPAVLLRQIAEEHRIVQIVRPQKYLEKRIENLN